MFANDVLLLSSMKHIGMGLVLGLILSVSYWHSDSRKKPSRNFLITMVVLPSVISVVITMVGSNMAKAVSIVGVFALVRFRSVPGDSRDIFYVFLSMAAGIAVGMECYLTGLAMVLILGIVFVLLSKISEKTIGKEVKHLKITVPENMNIKGVFDSTFEKYLADYKILSVRTTNMGTLFQLTYEVVAKKEMDEKLFLDELRVLNGNLNIVLGYPEANDAAIL